MEQTQLPLTMARIDGPSVVDRAYLKTIKTYRQAVRAAWALSRVKGTSQRKLQRVLAESIDGHASHISDWLNVDDKPTRRSLPAHLIPQFEAHVGNTLVSQWLAAQANLTVLEEMQVGRLAA